jgi:hypothetical protein
MDGTRSKRILAHITTAGAFVICLAIAAGVGGPQTGVPRNMAVAPGAVAPGPIAQSWTTNSQTFATSSTTSTQIELAATPAPVTPAEPVVPTEATVASATATAVVASEPAPVASTPPQTETTATPLESAPAPADAAVAAVAAEPAVLSAVAELPPPIEVASLSHFAVQVSAVEPDADVVGLWAPDASSCSMHSFRQGLLPTIINTEGAWAGETFCMFKTRKPTESGWRVLAECTSGGDQWTAQVRLSLKGQHLIWESKRGRQVYTRCGSDLRMASAP